MQTMQNPRSENLVQKEQNAYPQFSNVTTTYPNANTISETKTYHKEFIRNQESLNKNPINKELQNIKEKELQENITKTRNIQQPKMTTTTYQQTNPIQQNSTTFQQF